MNCVAQKMWGIHDAVCVHKARCHFRLSLTSTQNIPKRDLYGCHSHPWKDNRSNCYCENVRKMKNCSTRNMRKIFCSKENFGWPPRGNTLRLTRVVWKSTQSSAVVCLNKESSLRVRVQYKREVLTIRVLWRLSSGKEKKRSLACRRHL